MNKREKRKQLREVLIKEMNKGTLKEGILEKLLMAFLSPMIKREVKKIKNDPDIIAAQQSVKYALDNYMDSLDRTIKRNKEMMAKEEEERAEFWKRYNKK